LSLPEQSGFAFDVGLNEAMAQPPREYSFKGNLLFSEGASATRQVSDILLKNVPGARNVTRACQENDKSGVDYWVECANGNHLAIDVKSRREDWAARAINPQDDLALETFSVTEKQKLGWTRDPVKRCDFILWIWMDTGRWCLICFPHLCAVMQDNWQRWRSDYRTAIQKTTGASEWHSECVYVPRKVVWSEIFRRFSGMPPRGLLSEQVR